MQIKYTFVTGMLVGLLSCQFCFAQLSAKESKIINSFHEELEETLQKDNLHSSISAALIKNNRVIWAQAFGYASTDQDLAADTGTIYRIGSLTKTFTAALLMQLVEEGKVQLDDTADKYVPELRSLKGYNDQTRFTLRQLASHTAGLAREPEMRGAVIGALEQWEKKLLACIPNTSFSYRPGEKFLYSNIGYAILGLALQRAVDIPYMQLVQQKILTPLHMDDTFFAIPDNKRSRLTQGISNDDKGKVNTQLPLRELEGRGYKVPNGGIFTTPTDLSKFILSLVGTHPLLQPGSITTMQTVPPGGENYGLGMGVVHNKRHDLLSHEGSVPGYTASYVIDQRNGYALILMRNYNTGNKNLEQLALDLLDKL